MNIHRVKSVEISNWKKLDEDTETKDIKVETEQNGDFNITLFRKTEE